MSKGGIKRDKCVCMASNIGAVGMKLVLEVRRLVCWGYWYCCWDCPVLMGVAGAGG